MLLTILGALLIPSAPPADLPDPDALAQRVLIEAVSDIAAQGLPPHVAARGVLVDVGSFQAGIGAALNEEALLTAAGPGSRSLDHRRAVECSDAPASVRGCRVVNGGLYVKVDSVNAGTARADVVVTTSFTERRRQTSAIGFRRVRLIFEHDGREWSLVHKELIALS